MAKSAHIKKTDEEWTNFRSNLRRLMTEGSLSGKEMAELIGTTNGYVSKILCGRVNPGADTLANIADCFGVSASSLFFDEDRAKVAEWKAFGSAVKKARQDKGWALEYTARCLSLDPVDYGIIEKGDRSISGPMKIRVCNLLGLNQHKPVADSSSKKSEEVRKPKAVNKQTKAPERTTILQTSVKVPAKKSKKTAAYELSDETISIVMLNIKSLPIPEDTQRKVFREFANLRISREEKMLFG